METNIFKSYDVRGIYPSQINEDAAKRIGNAVAGFLTAKTLVIGEDGRSSSPQLRQAVVEGVTVAGCDVIYIGQCTTPAFYYAIKRLEADGGIMITASHNPAEYNGLKIMKKNAAPVDRNSGLQKIKELAAGEIFIAEHEGRFNHRTDMLNNYVDFLINVSGVKPGLNLKIIADAGNGVSSLVIAPLFDKLKINYAKLFFDIDGSFPNRSPDPARNNGLETLAAEVKKQKADMGLAFDGDADRLAVVDEKGEFVPAQYILAILWQNGGKTVRKHKVVYDLRFSRAVKEFFGDSGIRSVVGHSYLAGKMRETDALVGGETSGHFFFRETNYNESAALAALKLIKILQESGGKLSELIQPFKQGYYSGEINIAVNNPARPGEIIGVLKNKYKDEKIDELDGLTVENSDWWFNIRQSNTEPAMRLVVEANTEALVEAKIAEIKNEIENLLSLKR
ncbi:MAG: hypothetical protein A2746_01845 [Candidatus Yanofskybacteria bacterium RIFCSPHIGHO2_01_FULL_44_22]|uniref:Phosphomannomutase/phosphoglucomutase n=1 Tax=Candidatus Yanofskybacteria bacterium RIFCSPHIGHO2_01_FULL_44_22 TaxID=1802669 RepID=A0A1F8EST7_9BACT|nr:MAG: hypothetical protein A2746_01845 [Candidatus Yanofskybacteria bacterium RIFCSPHIGHO2_01_FULL_44_22]OGN08942.1 MAG: hypothetical protein A3C64_01230 [Candidatus Yanofskybacteria bacterium RIFCSPHIGHO2_02_FULL_41_12]